MSSPRSLPRRVLCAAVAPLLAASVAAAQPAGSAQANKGQEVRGQDAGPPVIACTSLANLRMVLRGVKDDAAAAVPIVTDPKSDLGCSPLDRGAVTGIADRVALNGRAYDCLALQGTNLCHWTVAGSVRIPASRPATDKGRR